MIDDVSNDKDALSPEEAKTDEWNGEDGDDSVPPEKRK